MKVQKKFLLQGAILLFLGLGLGFGLGSFYASAPVIGCRENDLTPIPDEVSSPLPQAKCRPDRYRKRRPHHRTNGSV